MCLVWFLAADSVPVRLGICHPLSSKLPLLYSRSLSATSRAAMRRVLLWTAALTAAALKPAVTRRGWCTGAAAAITSLAPQVASADGVGPGMFVETKNIASNPDASRSRDPMNSNVLFSQDFYFKYGRSPPFLQDATSEIPDGGAVPFTRVQQRYEAYGKYAARVLAGVEAFRALKGAVDDGSWATAAADDTKYNLRAVGLLANGLMASENNGPGNVLFLTRWYVNECALDIGDVAKAADKAQAAAAWERGRKAINSALIVLNKEISPKVGEQFVLVER